MGPTSFTAPVSSCRGCPRWQMDQAHLRVAIWVQHLFVLTVVIFGAIYALPPSLEMLRPPLRLALLLTTLVQASFGLRLARHLQAGVKPAAALLSGPEAV